MIMTDNALATAEGLIYHVFPLGQAGVSHSNDEALVRGRNIAEFRDWIPHLKELGVNAVLFGPVTHSGSHGYDTIDLYSIDPRLGSNADFARLCGELHDNGIAVIMDAVFNHSGRGFFAFQDLQRHLESSPYRYWYEGVDFTQNGPEGDGFSYASWDGHSSLPKLNVRNPEVRSYLLGAMEKWIGDFGIDGMRMDAADVIDPELWPILRRRADELYPATRQLPFNSGKFWIMGEMVFGDYASICREGMLDSITNYELYKGLYSSHNDANYHEVAWTLNRQFGPDGIYRNLKLYTFADNHDVQRIASTLQDERHNYPLHILLFTVPGIPSLYYGSETGIEGRKGKSDWELRPELHPEELLSRGRHPDLIRTIRRLGEIRRNEPLLQDGAYRQVLVQSSQLVFAREQHGGVSGNQPEGTVLIMVNSADEAALLRIPAGQLNSSGSGHYRDLLNGDDFTLHGDDQGSACLEVEIPAGWGRILKES